MAVDEEVKAKEPEEVQVATVVQQLEDEKMFDQSNQNISTAQVINRNSMSN
jgi:hypothetical protein